MTLARSTAGERRSDGKKVFTDRLMAVWLTHPAIREAPARAE
jgi:hypothetical protein